MNHLHIDVETFSSVDLECGTHVYTQSPDFHIQLIAYKYNDEPTVCVDLTCEPFPDFLLDALNDPEVQKIAHNAYFEITCLEAELGIKLKRSQWYCTMIGVAWMGLPMGLGAVATALRLDQQKNTEGATLIRFFSKPQVLRGGVKINNPRHHAARWEAYKQYNIQDVETEVAIYNWLVAHPQQPEIEHLYWRLDLLVNDRGVMLDDKFCRACIDANDLAQETLRDEMVRITGLENPNSTSQLSKWLSSKLGYPFGSLGKEFVKDYLNRKDVPELVKRVLRLRQQTSRSSVSKYGKMLMYQGFDGRCRGMIQYYGAMRTGRYAGRGPQPHNLVRSPDPHKVDIDHLRRVFKSGRAVQELEDVSKTASELVRTAFIAAPGMKLIPCDFNAIEARVTAWLAREQWRLGMFETPGSDIYKVSYAKMFDVPVERVGDKERQIGKVAELALGFGGSVGAMVQFGAVKMGIQEDALLPIVMNWRAASPRIKRLWYDVEDSAKKAVRENKTVILALPFTRLVFKKTADYLYITLPSGRFLAYYRAGVFERDTKVGNRIERAGGLYYYGIDDRNQFNIIPTYGGSLVENIVQAVARDLLADAMLRCHDEGVNIVMHVHDEIVAEEPADRAQETLDLMAEIMAEAPDWATGLPLRAVGFISDYYRKD